MSVDSTNPLTKGHSDHAAIGKAMPEASTDVYDVEDSLKDENDELNNFRGSRCSYIRSHG